MTSIKSKTITLPEWINNEIKDVKIIEGYTAQMDFVLNLAKKNVVNKTGGPFAAAVFNKLTGELISAATNIVVLENCSAAHAEIVALILAQEKLKQHRLIDDYALVSSAQPCVMCNGALIWSGVKTLIFGATKEDVESITGFDEGPMPDNWKYELEKRGIEVVENINHKAACEVLELYTKNGGELY